MTENSLNQPLNTAAAIAQPSQSAATNPPPAEASSLQSPVTIYMIRIIGYGLLSLFLFDLIALLIPFQPMNPNWEFQRFGDIVDRLVVPLLAIGLIFYGDRFSRKPVEHFFLKLLSWLCLGFAIVLILLVPLATSNVYRINMQTGAQFAAQYNQQLEQLNRLEEGLQQASGEDLVRFLESQGQTVAEGSPQQIKQRALENLAQSKTTLEQEFETTRSQQRLSLIKDGARWSIGALVAATLFIYLWRYTRWARSNQRPTQKQKRSRPVGLKR